MNKEARVSLLLFTAVVLACLIGCAHRAAYSEMDANRASSNRNQSQSKDSQPAEPTPTPATPSTLQAGQPAAPPTPAFKSPSFLDQAKGEIRDLPSYPRAQRISAQVGPMQGSNMMSIALRSIDPMDKIRAYYERVINENKWTVVDKISDPEFSEWNLQKGEDNSAKVQIKKEQTTAAMNIIIVRGEKIEGAGK